MSHTPSRQSPSGKFISTDRDVIVVAGSSPRTIEALRLATVRSDDVILIAPAVDERARDFCRLFAVEIRPSRVEAKDLDGIAALIVTMGDVDAENRLVRMARRRRVPVHVAERPLVSDFTLLDLVERRRSTLAAA